MKRIFLLPAVVLLISTNALQAQYATSRFQKQHMKQTEESLVAALTSESPGMREAATQTIRQLEWTYPDQEFKSIVLPLARIVKDEKGDTQARLLAAIALDGLHSDSGDEAIQITAKVSNNKSVQDLCTALIRPAGK